MRARESKMRGCDTIAESAWEWEWEQVLESPRVRDEGVAVPPRRVRGSERWFRVSARRGGDKFNSRNTTLIFQKSDVNMILLMLVFEKTDVNELMLTSIFKRIDVNQLALFINIWSHFC